MRKERSFQEYFPGGLCFGCGISNKRGIHVTKSYWVSKEHKESICNWRIKKYCSAAFGDTIHGGTLFTLMDCHSIWTAIASRYDLENRPYASDPAIIYVTAGAEKVKFLKPAPTDAEVATVISKVNEMGNESRRCILFSEIVIKGVICASAEIIAVRIYPAEEKIHMLRGEAA